jgi:hypothetical protein
MASRIADVEIKPKSDVLKGLQFSREDFYRALAIALDNLEGRPRAELPAPSQIPILVRGKERPMGELARIRFSMHSAPATGTDQ